MGPIVQFLGGPGANLTKTFTIRWPDEASQNRAPLMLEIVEKGGSKTNHKIIKASQLKSNLKVSSIFHYCIKLMISLILGQNCECGLASSITYAATALIDTILISIVKDFISKPWSPINLYNWNSKFLSTTNHYF